MAEKKSGTETRGQRKHETRRGEEGTRMGISITHILYLVLYN